MNRYARSHFTDPSLLSAAETHAGQARTATADLLADLAEIDARRLHVPMGYRSLHEYCTARLRLSEDAAYKRMQAARMARRFPVIFGALAEGRLHLAGICLLAAHLTEENAADLLAAAMDKSKLEIDRLVAERFPKSELLAWTTWISSPTVARVGQSLAPGQVNASLPPPPAPGPRPRTDVLSAGSYGLQVTISRRAHEQLQRLQDLLGASMADVGQILEDALGLYLAEVERRRLAATERPARHPRPTRSLRHIPAPVRRAVRQRDGGRCAFVSEDGRRCSAHRGLQFDHILPVARGGEATVTNLRLLCRAHNQHVAEREFGAEFMRHKRAAAAGVRQPRKAPETPPEERDIIRGLRTLGYTAREARAAASSCKDMIHASPEERMRVALSHFGRVRSVPTSGAPASP